MLSLASIAQSGLQAAQTRLGASAHNVANGQTEGFKRVQAQAAAQPQGGVQVTLSRAATEGADLNQDVVDQLSAKQSFAANLAVLKTADRVMGSLLDTQA
jgi:flagellar hook protein FlgE